MSGAAQVIESAHAAWAGDEYVRAAQLYVKVLQESIKVRTINE